MHKNFVRIKAYTTPWDASYAQNSTKRQPYAAVHPLLNHYTTMPVTLATLFNFKSNRAWSGIKLASFVFYQLCSRRRIVKAELQSHVKEGIVELMADKEPFPVSDSVNKCLTEPAGKLSGEITSINNKEVMNAVGKKIKTMIESEDA
ncbi:hypothetical protein BGZ94_005957 [Podila epigama]|nr:hypothetical protein BGZ94_005957 [Podila epigama]